MVPGMKHVMILRKDLDLYDVWTKERFEFEGADSVAAKAIAWADGASTKMDVRRDVEGWKWIAELEIDVWIDEGCRSVDVVDGMFEVVCRVEAEDVDDGDVAMDVRGTGTDESEATSMVSIIWSNIISPSNWFDDSIIALCPDCSLLL